MIDLEEKYIVFIKNIILKYLPESRIYIFGSRATGHARKYSDVDVAVEDISMTDKIQMQIEIELENSTLPYEVDVIDLNNISERFKSQIVDDLIEI